YIIVNPDDEPRNGILPDATVVPMRARSYRCWLNTVNANLSHTLNEVILPGQPSYGPLNANVNNLPNRFRANSSVQHNQVVRIPEGGGADLEGTGYDVGASAPTMAAFGDAFFWDLRRATNNRGGAPFDRPTYPYTPRPITKIDFDLTRFKMAVERTLLNATTSTIYYPSKPVDSATWGDFVFNSGASPGSYGLGVGAAFGTFPTQDELVVVQKSQAAEYAPTKIVVGGMMRPGNGAASAYAGVFVIADSTDGTTYTDRYTSLTDENSVTYTPLPGKTHLRVRQYLAGAAPAANVLCDEEIIPIVVDGSATPVIVLTNDYHTVPSSVAGTALKYVDAFTDIYVYVGGVDDTANWTFSKGTTTGGANGTFGTGSNANRFTANALSSGASTVGTVTLLATKGATTIPRVMTLSKQSAVSGLISPPSVQADHGRWITLNSPLAVDPFRMYYAPANPADPQIESSPGTFEVTAANLVNTSVPSPWFDGITVYVHSVDAELRGDGPDADTDPDRIDSGVRLWNGRGSVISLSGSTYPGRTGFSLATNDAAYIVGHFNADGLVNPSSSSSTNPGGYSARYPESSTEMLASVMADAITILSQPSFVSSGGNYNQTGGWSDSLSAHRKDNASAYTVNWATTNPSAGSNRRDGVNTSFAPARMPFLGNAVAGAGSATTYKLPPTATEISTALLMGLVPTNHNPSGLTDGAPSPSSNNQTSGGVHNFPRLAEHWVAASNQVELYIRGSMVAMFESRVAMEPWSLRVYTAAERLWGLHESLRTVNHDLPLEPVLLNARRVRYKELAAAQYTAQKTIIEALPH
ncbi:MAG: hypothetical protein ACREH8_00735, partial [Opitutaceae bacterium]